MATKKARLKDAELNCEIGIFFLTGYTGHLVFVVCNGAQNKSIFSKLKSNVTVC